MISDNNAQIILTSLSHSEDPLETMQWYLDHWMLEPKRVLDRIWTEVIGTEPMLNEGGNRLFAKIIIAIYQTPRGKTFDLVHHHDEAGLIQLIMETQRND